MFYNLWLRSEILPNHIRQRQQTANAKQDQLFFKQNSFAVGLLGNIKIYCMKMTSIEFDTLLHLKLLIKRQINKPIF